MRFVFALTILAVLLTGPVMAQDLTSDKGKLSYAVGWDIGQDIQRRGAEFDVETIIAAIRDSAAGSDPQIPSEEMVAMLTELQKRVREEQIAALQKLAEENQSRRTASWLCPAACSTGSSKRVTGRGRGWKAPSRCTIAVQR
jgi:FKBP-type peptidyl-prolyl cis-trans isomerase